MPIPESQLKTLSHHGSIIQSSQTYNAIKRVLEESTTPYSGKTFEVFLQGSYCNDTNIRAESDVDIIIRLDDSYHSEISSLSERERSDYKAKFSAATYTYTEFKQDVMCVLEDKYGSAVRAGDKAIAIEAGGLRRKADVIVATQFRRYLQYRSAEASEYTEGICFFNNARELIANYPKQHSANLTAKHQASSKWLKPMIRVLKNMRSHMVDEKLIKAGAVPSYYLECLLYNVPSEKFTHSFQNCMINILNWYREEASKTDLVCANEQYYLLRDGYHTCWSQEECDAFIEGAIELWNQW